MFANASDGLSAENATLNLWINRGLEALWLMAVALVPLAYLDRDFISSEAVIAYVEVPKVALLRTLVALMAMLWLVEWAINGRLPRPSLLLSGGGMGQGRQLFSSFLGWLRGRPARWVFVAVWIYLGTTILSTLLSASFEVSLWGEVPGQDGYSAYTVISYVLLFAVIATHVKNKPQVWRLLGAIALMGTLVAGYAILQHYGQDPLNLTEQTGGGKGRVTSIMGNAIFAAAVMFMTIPITLLAATLSLRVPNPSIPLRAQVRSWFFAVVSGGLWGLVVVVQLLGITFTFSRGPWIGTLSALAIFLVLAAVFVERRIFLRTLLILGISSVLALSLLQAFNSVSLLDQGRWLGAVIALIGLAGLALFIGIQERLIQLSSKIRRSWMALGAAGILSAAVIALVLVIAPNWFAVDQREANSGETISSEVSSRLSSIKSEVLTGGLGGRSEYWEGSWRLVKDNPWFENRELNLGYIRPLVGYGPDLFRYTYLLESPPTSRSFLSEEPDHAHNFFINQLVEQGFLGLFSSLGIFVAVFLAAGYQILRQRSTLSNSYKLVLIALLAIIAGRFLEQIVGVARVSDLTLFWALLGLFAALPTAMMGSTNSEVRPAPTQVAQLSRRERRQHSRSVAPSPRYNWNLFFRLAIISVIFGGVFVLTWLKSVNYVRAAHSVSDAIQHFRESDPQRALSELDRAIELAPDVSLYYNHRGNVYLAYMLAPNGQPEQDCQAQTALPYRPCLAAKYFQDNLDGVANRPFYFRAQMSLANAAFNLQLEDESIQFYRNALALVPNSWPVRNQLADAYIHANRPAEALPILEESIEITGGDPLSAAAYLLRGIAYRDLGESESSIKSLNRSLDLNISGERAVRANQILAEHYVNAGQFDLAKLRYDALIELEPKEADNYAYRSIYLNELGNFTQAVKSYESALALNPEIADEIPLEKPISQAYAAVGVYELGLVLNRQAIELLDETLALNPKMALDYLTQLRSSPGDAVDYANRSIAYAELGDFKRAVADYEVSLNLDADIATEVPLAKQIAQAYAALGAASIESKLFQEAIERYDRALKLEPDMGPVYIGRAQVYDHLEMYQLALGDLTQAIEFEPDSRSAYSHRGDVYSHLREYGLAVEDYSRVIDGGFVDIAILTSRGLAYTNLGQYSKAIDDLTLATSLIPDTLALELEPQIELAHEGLRATHRERGSLDELIDSYSTEILNDPKDAKTYIYRANAYADSGLLDLSIQDFSQAIQLSSSVSLAYTPDVTGSGTARGSFGFTQGGAGGDAALYDNSFTPGADPGGLRKGTRSSYDFGPSETVHIRRVVIENSPIFGVSASSTWTLAYSANGKDGSWVPVGEFTMVPGKGNTHTHDFPASGHHRFWQIEFKSGETLSGNVWIDEVEMMEEDSPYPAMYTARGKAYLDSGDYRLALQDLDQAILTNATYLPAYMARGRAYAELGQYNDALSSLDLAVLIDPLHADAYIDRAEIQLSLDQPDRALAELEQAITLDKELARAYSVKGNALSLLIEYGQAIDQFDQALKLDPDLGPAYLGRAQVYVRLEMYQLALEDLTRAIELEPESASANSLRGDVYSHFGEHALAVGDYSRAIDAGIVDVAILTPRGQAYTSLGQYSKAVGDLTLAISLDPQLELAHESLRAAHVGRGSLNELIDFYSADILSDPDNATTYIYRANAYAVAGLLDLSVQDFNQAMQLSPSVALAYTPDVTGSGAAGGSFGFTQGGAGGDSALYDNSYTPGADPGGIRIGTRSSYDFGASNTVHIRRVVIKNSPVFGITDSSTWTLAYSSNGKDGSWVPVGEFTMVPGKGNTHTHDFPTSGHHRFWQIEFKSGETLSGNVWLEEIEMMEEDAEMVERLFKE